MKHVKPQDTNVNDYDHVYRMDIEGMHCKNCAMRIENVFNEQPDCMAKVDLAGKFVRIYTKKPVEEVRPSGTPATSRKPSPSKNKTELKFKEKRGIL